MDGCTGSAGVVSAGTLDMTCLAALTVPGQVRALVELRLAEWGLAGVGDDVTLIASELVTNAVRCAPEREIRVRFTRELGAVLLAVWDSSDVRPVRKRVPGAADEHAAPDAEALNPGHDDGTGGHGLPIVEALSEKCGVTPTRPHGKWVWSRYATVGPVPGPTGGAVTDARVPAPRS